MNEPLNSCFVFNITITSNSGETLDVTKTFLQFDIFEDLFSHFLVCNLTIEDTNDILKNLPIIGGEQVQIVFGDTSQAATSFIYFTLVSVLPPNEINDENTKKNIISLLLKSVEAVRGEKLRLCKKFNATSNSPLSIIKEVLHSEQINSYEIVSDSPNVKSISDFIANFWNLNQLINYVCEQCGDVFFYQTIDTSKAFNLKSLSDLVQQNPIQTLHQATSLENQISRNTVFQFMFSNYFDIQRVYDMGGFGKTIYEVSNENYSYKKESKTLEEVYDDGYPLMGSNKIFQSTLSSQDNSIGLRMKNEEYDTDELFDNQLKRNLIIQSLQNYNLIVKTNGSSERHVGDCVALTLPSTDNKSTNENFQHSWLITQIRHTVTNNMVFRQNIRLFKNAFFNNSKVG